MIIEKKTWPKMFERVLLNKKKHEIRLNDFNVNPGDIIVFKEWDPNTQEYTGREVEKKVGFVTRTKDLKYWDGDSINKFGFVVMDLE